MKRSAGILLHPTSLPSAYGIGDFGPAAYRFIDFLQAAQQRAWAMLPLTIPDSAGSPYASPSAFAMNWMLISPEQLLADQLLDARDMPHRQPIRAVSYGHIYTKRRSLIDASWKFFQQHATAHQKKMMAHFCKREAAWLEPYAQFMTIKDRHRGTPWYQWPSELAQYNKVAIRTWHRKHQAQIKQYCYEQWLIHDQWQRLKTYANAKSIQLYGDIPFFVTHDSVDVWTNQKSFLLNAQHQPISVSGVPPDYFSRRGQIWNNPHYDWMRMKKNNFAWWRARFTMATRLFDIIRLDHFRGFYNVWHIPTGAKTARFGAWELVPGEQLLKKVLRSHAQVPFVAEDLGSISPEVVTLRKRLRLPGMRVLQFGFGGLPDNYHNPKNFPTTVVAYTGTHDNDTSRGWFTGSGSSMERWLAGVRLKADRHTFSHKLMRYGMRSRAQLFITPLQDVLNLGSKARMNTPGTKRGNWRWRFASAALSDTLSQQLRRLTRATKR